MSRVVAIIPARGGSQGIPRKNLKKIEGLTLVEHAIQQGLAAHNIDEVIVSSEDAEIRDLSETAGARVMDRPEEFHHDNSIQEVDRLLQWTVGTLRKRGESVDVVVLLYPTAPLRRVETIEAAVGKVLSDEYDSVLSLYEDFSYLWKVDSGQTSPMNYDPKTRGPRQKETWNQWVENKAVYAFRADLLLETGCRLGGRTGYVEMGKLESLDIDSVDDLELARVVFAKRQVRD